MKKTLIAALMLGFSITSVSGPALAGGGDAVAGAIIGEHAWSDAGRCGKFSSRAPASTASAFIIRHPKKSATMPAFKAA